MVGWINWISRIARVSTIQSMVPLSSDLSTSCNRNNRLRNGLMVGVNSTVANDIVRSDVHYRLKKPTFTIR